MKKFQRVDLKACSVDFPKILITHNFSAADGCLCVRQTTADKKKCKVNMQTTEAVPLTINPYAQQ